MDSDREPLRTLRGLSLPYSPLFASLAPASHHLVHLQSLYRDRDSTGFVEAYLEALELQRSFTASASAGQATLPFPVRLPSRPFSRYRSASDQCA